MSGVVCLLIHGFGGGIEEIAFLEHALQRNGLAVETVLLHGHGGSKQDLRKSNGKDWQDSVKAALASLKSEYSEIVLVGFSMGGLLSILFAADSQVSKLVLINTPIYFWNLKIIIRDILGGIVHPSDSKIGYYLNSVTKTSLKSGIDFLKVLQRAKSKIGSTEKPALVLQCTEDESVNYQSADYIRKRMGCRAQMKLYEGGCHQLFAKAPELRAVVCRDIIDFIVNCGWDQTVKEGKSC